MDPPKAQYETGFSRWICTVANLTRQIGCRVIFCSPTDIQPLIRGVLYHNNYGIRCEFRTASGSDDLVLLSNAILDDDLFILIGRAPTQYPSATTWPIFLTSLKNTSAPTTSSSYIQNSSDRKRHHIIRRPIGRRHHPSPHRHCSDTCARPGGAWSTSSATSHTADAISIYRHR